MANVDRLNGFSAVKTLSGAPVSSLIRAVGVADGEDIFVGDALALSSGLATPFDTNDACLGVAVGFGKVNAMNGLKGNSYGDPANLNTPRYYDDSANTHTDWVVYYVPADDVVFEAQTDAAVTLKVGDTRDVLGTTGNTTTGISAQEIDEDGTTNADVAVVEIPDYVDNDPTLIHGRYWVIFTDTAFSR